MMNEMLDKYTLRRELWDWIIDNPITPNALSNEIGIAPKTLNDFLDPHSKRNPNMKLLLQVKKFLREKYAIRDKEISERFNNG